MSNRCNNTNELRTRCSLAEHPDTIACFFIAPRSVLAMPQAPQQAEHDAAMAIGELAGVVGFVNTEAVPIDVIRAATQRIDELARLCERLAHSVGRSELVDVGNRIASAIEGNTIALERGGVRGYERGIERGRVLQKADELARTMRVGISAHAYASQSDRELVELLDLLELGRADAT